ncbi:MAG: 50S ribosomal protein L16 [Chloroflexi bacterium]|nr:50S ribosomal protein L16 [Chloroflexota bacterium]
MLQPRRVKFRKMMRGNRGGKAIAGSTLAFGEYGLKALEPAWITSRQIEAARRAITRRFRRGGQVWIRIFPDKPVSKKPAEVRQGGGKAAVDHYIAVVKPGRILFEVSGVTEETARNALWLASQKLPIPVRTVQREERGAAAPAATEE